MSVLEITGKSLENNSRVICKTKKSVCCNIVTLTFKIQQLFIYSYVNRIKTKGNYGKRGKVLEIKTLCATLGVSLQGQLYLP